MNAASMMARAEVLSGASDSLVYWPAVDGFLVVPLTGSAYVTVFSPDGAELVARASATTSSEGRLSVSRTWGVSTFPIQADYFAVWEWQTDDGLSHADRQSFDVVKQKLPVLLSGAHLEEILPRLKERLAELKDPSLSVERFALVGWLQLCEHIRAQGKRPSLIMERDRLVNPARYLALSLACEALEKQPGDLWATRASDYRKLHREFLGLLANVRYDVDEDNTTSPEETASIGVPRVRV